MANTVRKMNVLPDYCLGLQRLKIFLGYYTLLPGAFCFGLGRAFNWICSGSFIAVYATEFHRLFGPNKSFAEYFSIVNALHFASLQSSQVTKLHYLFHKEHLLL